MSPPHNPPNQLRFSPLQLSFPTDHRRCSKAQMCFFNILHIISVFPTVNITNDKYLTHDDEISENRGFVVDLNIRLHPPPESDRFNSPATTSGDAVGENCVFEKNDQSSEISHVGDQSSGVDFNSVSEFVVEEEEEGKPRDEGYLGLLIEAAQLVLGDDSDNQEKKPVTGRKRKPECCTPEWYEDTSPVVKSKRGRSQVLPYKYRDSVVEPLVRWTSPAMSQRLFSNATVRSKRRSK